MLRSGVAALLHEHHTGPPRQRTAATLPAGPHYPQLSELIARLETPAVDA